MRFRDPNIEPDPVQTRRRMRREFGFMAILVLVIAAIAAVEKWALPIPSAYNFSNNVVFFALINLNVILICVLIFLVLRNLAKLVFERRREILGSRLRTKLIVAFTGFALLPTVIMFYVALTFVTRSINNWFSLQIESSLQETLDVAQNYYSLYQTNAKFFAKSVAASVQSGEHLGGGGKPAGAESTALFNAEALASMLTQRKNEYNVDSIQVFRSGLTGAVASTAPTERWEKELRPATGVEDIILAAYKGETTAEILNADVGEVVRGATPVYVNGRPEGAVLVMYKVPSRVLHKMASIRKTYEDYRKLTLLKDPVMSSYYAFFALISLFIFFAATWFGFFLARGIAVPIQRLADATEEVAAGNLDVSIPVRGNDEMDRLIGSFNRMIVDLKHSRQAAEQAHEELRGTNIELEQRRRYIETVLSNVSAGVVSFLADGRIATINRPAMEWLGLNESPIGLTYAETFGPLLGDTQTEELRRAMIAQPEGRIEREIELKIGEDSRTFIMRVSLVRSAAGETLYAVMVIDDLTELIRAKRVAAWREIARRIAHEIKNPLTPIQLAAQRLRKRYATRFDEEADKAFFDSTATIIRQVTEMKRLVQEFSDFARLAEVLPAPNPINDIISETLVLYTEAHTNVKFTFNPAPDLPTLLLDRSQLKRVFINLLDNAVDAVGGSGAVTVTTGIDQEAGEVHVTVDDDGAGLPPAYRQRLFEPYFSTKKMGTGLGLAIVHQIMTDHGGRIEMRENRPRGTRVLLAFPLTLSVAVA